MTLRVIMILLGIGLLLSIALKYLAWRLAKWSGRKSGDAADQYDDVGTWGV